jgi:hypothetical protein
MALTNVETAQAMVANRRWADRLGWGTYAAAIATAIGSPSSDVGSAELAQAVATFQQSSELSTDGIIGPDTWAVLQERLAPAGSLTGVRPADAPPLPNGFDEVIATFGDPRPFIAADGSIGESSLALWERQTLSRGQLPFPVPIDAKNPAAGVKTTFYAHRKLTATFEAVFAEILRLGLKDLITSWDGLYNFRPIRGTTSQISLHAFGAALDLNAAANALGTDGNMDQRLIDVFEHFGFFWGGQFHSRPDPMHFQYATGY